MEKMIAHCGLECTACPAFLATQNDDQKLREETAVKWSEIYNSDIKPEYINCHGCKADDGVQFGWCSQCGIRACSHGRGLANCAHCDEYACDKISEFAKMAPEAKVALDEIKAQL